MVNNLLDSSALEEGETARQQARKAEMLLRAAAEAIRPPRITGGALLDVSPGLHLPPSLPPPLSFGTAPESARQCPDLHRRRRPHHASVKAIPGSRRSRWPIPALVFRRTSTRFWEVFRVPTDAGRHGLEAIVHEIVAAHGGIDYVRAGRVERHFAWCREAQLPSRDQSSRPQNRSPAPRSGSGSPARRQSPGHLLA